MVETDTAHTAEPHNPSAMLADRLGAGADDFYAALMQSHEGLSFEQSNALNARLVLILANEVGDTDRLKTLLGMATEG